MFLVFANSKHLFTLSIDTWIESFEKENLLWTKLLFYSGVVAVCAFLSFKVPHKVALTKDGIQLHIFFNEPKTIKWENITRFEIIENKRYKVRISLLIESAQFSTEGWPNKRPGFELVHSGIKEKIRSLAERKMVREVTDNGSIYPNEKPKFGEDVGS
jgi:hypothetical protein